MDLNIKFLLHKASFLDPRFKTLTHLSVILQEEIFENILEEALLSVQCVQNDIQIEKVTESSDKLLEPGPSIDEPTKKKKNALMELIGSKFHHDECDTDTALRDIVQSELFRYKAEPSIAVNQCPLHRWAAYQHIYTQT